MNTLKKIHLISFLAGTMLLSVLFVHGQKVNLNEFSSTINHPAFSAGNDATICNDTYFLTQGYCSVNEIFMWSSSGDGIFDDTQNLQTIYTPGESDVIRGEVTIYLHLFPLGGGGNELIYDEMILNLGDCTIINQF